MKFKDCGIAWLMKWIGTLIVNEHIFGTWSSSRVVSQLTSHDLKKKLRVDWPNTVTAQAMIPAELMKRICPDAELTAALGEMDRDGVNQLPVMVSAQIQGVLGRDDVIGLLGTLGEFCRK